MLKNLALVLLVPSTVACHQPPPRDCTVGSTIHVQVRSPINDLSNRSIALEKGDSVAGTFDPTAALRVDAIAVQIGNGGAGADGDIVLEICQDGRCAKGAAAVQDGKDNDYLEVRLTPSLPLTFDGGAVSYVLKRESGARGILVWAYPGFGGKTKLVNRDQSSAETLNLMMRQY